MANSLEDVRKFFEGDKYATEATGIVIEKAEKGHSVVSLEPDGRHLNAVGGLMGAVYYTMADFAFAVAVNCELDSDTITVTQATQMNFLRSWHGGKVTCHADIVKDGSPVGGGDFSGSAVDAWYAGAGDLTVSAKAAGKPTGLLGKLLGLLK